MRYWIIGLLLAGPLLFSGKAAAAFPDRTVRIVVPYPAGGSNDVIARLVAQRLSEIWGQGVIVENRAGAGGNVGAKSVARGEADGYTVLLTAPSPLVINQALYSPPAFDPEKEFAPIALVGSVPIVLAVHPQVKARSVAELVALAKAEPGNLKYGSSGIGSTNHLAGELLKTLAGIDIVHVPYRGAAPAMNDLVGGHIAFMFDNMPAVRPQVDGGQIRALAVAGAVRTPLYPDLPTMAEAGAAGFDASAWFGLAAPAGMPDETKRVWIASMQRLLKEPAIAAKLSELGAEPGTLTNGEFESFLRVETAKWSKIIKAAGVQAN